MTEEAGFDGDVLSEGSPELNADWVRALALRHYGIEGEMRPLTGERDRNYRFESARTGERFMLKISHPSETPLVADFQTQALLQSRAPIRSCRCSASCPRATASLLSSATRAMACRV